MDLEEEIEIVVIDNGSYFVKAGFAGEDAPRVVFPCVVARTKPPRNKIGLDYKDAYVGDEALNKTYGRYYGGLTFNNPIQKKQFTNWDDLERVWHHSFYNELRVAPEEHFVLLTECVLNPRASKERMTQIMFEIFDVRGLAVMTSCVLSLYPSGRTTGVVLDSGHDITHVVPIVDRFPIPHAVETVEVGGRQITEYMVKLLAQRGYSFGTSSEREMVREMKEQRGYVAQDFESEITLCAEENVLHKNYECYDGQIVVLESERFKSAEAMFQPHLIGKQGPGFDTALFASIMKCESDLRHDLFRNIVLAGGNTMFEGMKDRLKKELRSLAPIGTKIDVIAPPERKYSSWIGGSIISCYLKTWITKELYDQKGPAVIHEFSLDHT